MIKTFVSSEYKSVETVTKRSTNMAVDLTRTDEYEGEIPDADLELCLKVIRTVRNVCLGTVEGFFDADGAVILSHAHAKMVELIELAEQEDEA